MFKFELHPHTGEIRTKILCILLDDFQPLSIFKNEIQEIQEIQEILTVPISILSSDSRTQYVISYALLYIQHGNKPEKFQALLAYPIQQ